MDYANVKLVGDKACVTFGGDRGEISLHYYGVTATTVTDQTGSAVFIEKATVVGQCNHTWCRGQHIVALTEDSPAVLKGVSYFEVEFARAQPPDWGT